MRADSSDCMSARHAHRGLARGYAALIEQNQDEHGAGAMLAEAE